MSKKSVLRASLDPDGQTPAPAAARRRAEHRFFIGYMIAMALVILIGFAPSFFLRGLVTTPNPLRPMRADALVHGLIATPLVLLFPIQALLVSLGRQRLHIALGKAGFILALTMVPLLYVVGSFSYRTTPPPMASLAPVMASLVLFALPAMAALLWLGWRFRFDGQAHKRFMAAFACLLTGPALSRMPLFPPPPAGIAATELVVLALLIPIWLWDLRTQRQLHWAAAAGTAIITGQTVFRLALMNTNGWAAFVGGLPGYGWS